MPVIKSAKKKLRQDKKRTEANKKVKEAMKELVKKAKKKPTSESVRLATKAIDKAEKKFILHKNTAARMKSGLSKLIKTSSPAHKAESQPAKPAKKAAVKSSLAANTSKAGKKKTAKK